MLVFESPARFEANDETFSASHQVSNENGDDLFASPEFVSPLSGASRPAVDAQR